MFEEFLFCELSRSLDISKFPSLMKHANISPIHRKVCFINVYYLISQNVLFKQIPNYSKSIFSDSQSSFRSCHSAQHCLLPLLEKWHKSMDQRVLFDALLTDFSKVFDSLQHNLLAVKLFECGLDVSSIRVNSLTNQKNAYWMLVQ